MQPSPLATRRDFLHAFLAFAVEGRELDDVTERDLWQLGAAPAALDAHFAAAREDARVLLADMIGVIEEDAA